MLKCKFCLEPIQENAKKCPHCIVWLKPWSMGGPMWVLAVGSVIFIASFIVPLVPLYKSAYSKPKITVIESHKIESRSNFEIIGQVKNEGGKIEKSIQVEAAFYDKNQKLVNIESSFLSGGFEAQEIRPFKIRKCSTSPASSTFDHYFISVR